MNAAAAARGAARAGPALDTDDHDCGGWCQLGISWGRSNHDGCEPLKVGDDLAVHRSGGEVRFSLVGSSELLGRPDELRPLEEPCWDGTDTASVAWVAAEDNAAVVVPC